jgi:hypothetical protein
MANWVSGDWEQLLALFAKSITHRPPSHLGNGGFGALCRGILTAMSSTVWTL